ncbi:MAG: DUF1294 domain-containing protein [Planctomycetota bacterium]|nr:DUF1294 domain-containing protein [Planctomycetota bacterium]
MPAPKYSAALWLASLWLLLCTAPAVVLAMYSKAWPSWLALIFSILTLLLSLTAATLFCADKRRAQAEQSRVSEMTLFTLSALGGWPGIVIAQQLLRHKSQKVSFRITLGVIVGAHLVATALYLWWRFQG